MVPERSRAPFQKIFLSRNGAPVNIVYHSQSARTIKVTFCTKFGQLVLRKIIEIVATRCHILRLKCTKFDVCSLPQTPLGKLTVLPTPLAGFKGAYF